jgi:glucose-1-phosphate cytidylyltransferase
VKAVILAGGLGTRLSEETDLVPKPMVTIGGMPILWHIMKIYHHHGVNDFIVCLGYKGYVVKEFFAHYALHASDVTIDMSTGDLEYRRRGAEPWRVTLMDTGQHTMTGGRLGRVRDLLDGTFLATYGDGVGDVDISQTIKFHSNHGRLATMTAVVPPGRYGALDLDPDGSVNAFREKPDGDGAVINGGYFVLEPEVLDRVTGDDTIFEEQVLPGLAADRQLAAYNHPGFWQPMDTLRDRRQLEGMWADGSAPWLVWGE